MKIYIEHKDYIIKELDNNIVHTHYRTAELSIESYKEMIGLAEEYAAKHGCIYLLTTQIERFTFSRDAWDYMKKNYKNFYFVTANVIIINHLHLRIIADFYTRLTRNISPTRVFSSEKNGLIWLEKQIKLRDSSKK